MHRHTRCCKLSRSTDRHDPDEGCQGAFFWSKIYHIFFSVVDGDANVRASAVMTHVNNDDTHHVIFDDTLCKILGTSARLATFLDLDLAFGAVDVNVDLACITHFSPLFPLPPHIVSPPPSAAAGEPI